MQLHSGHTQELCSGIDCNATAVIWSKLRLGVPRSPLRCCPATVCWVRPRDSNSAFIQRSLSSNPGRNSPVHATFQCESMGTVGSGLKSGFQDLTQFNLGITSYPTPKFFFVKLNN